MIERKWLGTTLDLSAVPLTAAAEGSGSGAASQSSDEQQSSDDQLDPDAEGTGAQAEQDA